MPRHNDPFHVLSDFIKGKRFRERNGGLASFAWEGDEPPPMPDPPDPHPTFAKIAAEHPSVAKTLAKSEPFSTAALIGGLLTLPELQANSIRLQALAHLAVWLGKGRKRPNLAQLSPWFNALDDGPCGRLEDPSEDLFISNVSDSLGNYRMFEGTAEGNAFHVQLFLDIVETMPGDGGFGQLRNCVHAILRLSEALNERVGLPRNIVGEPFPISALPKVPRSVAHQIRQRVVFSKADLAALEIKLEDLAPFIFDQDDHGLIAKGTFGHSSLEAAPLLHSHGRLAVVLPNANGISVRRFIIETCLQNATGEVFEKALADSYVRMFRDELLLGKLKPPAFRMVPQNNFSVADITVEIDQGRYLQLIFFCDSLADYKKTSFIGTNPATELTEFVGNSVTRARQQLSTQDGFREGLSLVVGCGWGRALGLGLPPDQPNWRLEMMTAHDLITLSRKPEFEPLDLFRVLNARDAIAREGVDLINVNGLVNLVGWVDQNRGHIVPHEKLELGAFDPEHPLTLWIPQNEILRIRAEVANGVDVHRVEDPKGNLILVRRAHSEPQYGAKNLTPFYIDLKASGRRQFRAVYEGSERLWWAEVERSGELDHDTMLHLTMMVQHWTEATARYLDEKLGNGAARDLTWSISFADTAMPDYADPIPSKEEVAQIANFEASVEERHAKISIGPGFFLGCRRPENSAERAVVRALIESAYFLQGIEYEQSMIDEAVQEVVRDDGARHFHAFSVLDVRDHVRGNLPTEGKIISRLDDAVVRIGLGWLVRDRSTGDKIEGKDACCAYLSKLTKAIAARMMSSLSSLERFAIIEALLINHEAIATEATRWGRTFRSVRALSEDIALTKEQATRKIGEFNAAQIASRIIVEMANCVSPLGSGQKPGFMEIGRLMADASHLFHFGGFSDAMKSGMMPATIRISPGGDILMDHEFTDKTVRPFGETFQSVMLDTAAERYVESYGAVENDSAENQAELENTDRETINEGFDSAWIEEYGFSIEEMRRFIEGFTAHAVEHGQAVKRMKRSDLVQFLSQVTKLPQATIEVAIATFSLMPRVEWDQSPEVFLPNAWHPWRFRRQLSVVSRPIVHLNTNDDPDLFVTPAMIVHFLSNFVTDVHRGRFDDAFFRSTKMKSWVGHTTADHGKRFNEKVAEQMRGLGWCARANLSDGEILQRKKDPQFGDVDVLAWKRKTGHVILGECKDLSLDKTFGEIARRLAKYQGTVSADGKRDDLRKHLDRFDVLKHNSEELAKFVGCNVERLEALVVTSQPVPMQFDENLKKMGARFVTIMELDQL